MLSNLTDYEKWCSFKKGDHQTVSLIYREYYPVLYRYGLKFTTHSSVVEDSIQDLFAEMIKNQKTIGYTDNILFYLLRSFRRKLIRKLNYANRYDSIDVMSDDLPFDVVWSVEQDFIRNEEKEEQSTMLGTILSELSSRQKEVVYLRFTKGLEYSVIAEIMGINVESCRNLISKAIFNLRNGVRRKSLKKYVY